MRDFSNEIKISVEATPISKKLNNKAVQHEMQDKAEPMV